MRILSLDTALGACSVSIVEDDKVVCERFEERTRGHAETLMDMIAEVESEAAMSVRDMHRLAVAVGPGTFTGLRVGLSAARGLALGASVPCVGITTLQAVAANVDRKNLTTNDRIAVVFDCHRGEVYHQIFNGDLVPLSLPAIDKVGAAAGVERFGVSKSGGARLVGSGAKLIASHCPSWTLDEVTQDQPRARNIAFLAAKIDDPETAPPLPLYLRQPDAKLPTKDLLTHFKAQGR